MEKFKQIAIIILLFVLSVPIIRPLFARGFFPMHDDTQPTRVYEMAQATRDGQIPVRWASDLGYGYGYPIFNFYAPLPYYFGAFINLAGFDILTATKIMFGVGILLAGVTMFFFGRKLWGELGGLISALFYMYAPYHAVQIYVRGAVGEYWAYAFLPLLGLGIWEIYTRQLRQGIFWGVVGFSGIILSHNISALIVGMFLGIWLIVQIVIGFFRPKLFIFLLPFMATILLSLSATAFFWLPAIVEAKYTKVNTLTSGTNDFHLHFVEIGQLWDSPWGFAGSAYGLADGMSFKIGKLHLIVAAASLVSLILAYFYQRKSKYLFLAAVFAAGSAISFYMTTSFSTPVWEVLPVFKFVQYPWRFLTFGLFFICILAGAFFETAKVKKISPAIIWSISVVVVVICLATNIRYFQPQFISLVTAADYISTSAIRWNISKISDEYMPRDFPIPLQKEDLQTKVTTTPDIIVENVETRSQAVTARVDAQQVGEIIFPIAFFPGWQVVVDGKKTVVTTTGGKLSTRVTQGKHIVTAYFANTLVRTISNSLSVFTVLLLFAIYMTLGTNKSYEKN